MALRVALRALAGHARLELGQARLHVEHLALHRLAVHGHRVARERRHASRRRRVEGVGLARGLFETWPMRTSFERAEVHAWHNDTNTTALPGRWAARPAAREPG